MNRMQEQVEEFHRELHHPIGSLPAFSRPQLRMDLIDEEANELINAIDAGDMIAVVDGMCDLLYVVFGTAVEFGIDLQPFFDEVHRSNLAKKGGAKRADGKTLKPAEWTPPQLGPIFDRQRKGWR